MNMRTKYFFVDTNLFLQCRDVGDLPWNEISDAQEIRLIIPRAVQNEIDRLKADGNRRRAKRARDTNAYFRKILLSDSEQLLICEQLKAKVTITFSSHTPASPVDVSDFVLDSDRPDDSILLEIVSYRNLYPEHEVALLTHDTNPILTAKRLKIPFQLIPDGWLLEPEADEREKEIRRLKTRLGELENNSPKIKFTFGTDATSVPEKIELEIVTYLPFSSDEILNLIEEIKVVYPMKQNFEDQFKKDADLNSASKEMVLRLAYGSYKPPTIDEINKYKNVEYPDWLRKVEKSLANLPKFFCEKRNKFEVLMMTENIGSFPAEHAIVKIETSDGLLIALPVDKENKPNWEFTTPPPPPTGKYVDTMNLANLFRAKSFVRNLEPLIKSQSSRRDRNKFYWKHHKPSLPKALWEFECEEFIHKDTPEEFYFELLVEPDKFPNNGLITFTVMARNLPNPACVKIPLKISYVEGNSMDEARVLCGLF